MSTWMYLECLDHDPPIVAVDESGQHHYDLPRIRAEIADRENVADADAEYAPAVLDDFDPAAYFRVRSARFLAAHRNCEVGIVDEYGMKHPTADDEPTS